MKCITYNGGYKYQLKETYTVEIEIKPRTSIDTEYTGLTSEGLLSISKGYAWDGPSGPTIDIPSFMRGALVHDALYQLMREGHLDHDVYRPMADRILRKLCVEDGMWRLYAWFVYVMVRRFGKPFADPADIEPVTTAPCDCKE